MAGEAGNVFRTFNTVVCGREFFARWTLATGNEVGLDGRDENICLFFGYILFIYLFIFSEIRFSNSHSKTGMWLSYRVLYTVDS